MALQGGIHGCKKYQYIVSVQDIGIQWVSPYSFGSRYFWLHFVLCGPSSAFSAKPSQSSNFRGQTWSNSPDWRKNFLRTWHREYWGQKSKSFGLPIESAPQVEDWRVEKAFGPCPLFLEFNWVPSPSRWDLPREPYGEDKCGLRARLREWGYMPRTLQLLVISSTFVIKTIPPSPLIQYKAILSNPVRGLYTRQLPTSSPIN